MKPAAPVLYCGDHALDDAARYLAAALRAAGRAFDYLPSNGRFSRAVSSKKYSLYILSDYPSRFLGQANARRIAQRVRAGAGLLMIGGWGSFTGVDGFYGRTPIADILPVKCLPRDDRRQGAPAYRLAPGRSISRLGAFNLNAAPTLAGYNKTLPKPGAEELLRVQTLRFGSTPGKTRVVSSDPLLTAWKVGRGRVVAYCSDLAPHWSGGLVDWGPRRLTLKAAPGVTAQVGSEFVRFAQTLVRLALKGSFREKK